MPRKLASGRYLHRLRAVLTGSFLLSLGACSLFNSPSVPSGTRCPEVRAVPELSSAYRFEGGTQNYGSMSYNIRLTDFAFDCDLDVDKATIAISFNLLAERGPKAAGAAHFPFFIAVADPDGKIISKRNVDTVFEFARGQSREGQSQKVTEVVSYSDPAQAENYAVLVGLQLSPAERDYNLRKSQK